MNGSTQKPGLGEAASHFLASLPHGKRGISQQEVYKFVRWYGWEQPLTRLTAPEVANYAKRLSLSDTDYAKKLKLIRAFLSYVNKEGWSKINLAVHLKIKKGKTKAQPIARQNLPETISLTQQGYTHLKAELAILKKKRPKAIEEIRQAAADKDFHENAPLDAAKEQRGFLEGRIKEIEGTLKSANIINGKQNVTARVSIGDSIILQDLITGEEIRYMIVSPREVDPTKGKISSASPIGRAVIGQGQGEIAEITAPIGKLRYQIKQIER